MKRNQKFEPDADARLMDQIKEVLRYHHYAYRTEKTYCDWILRYLKFHGGNRHPREMGKAEIERFLSHLAVQATLPLRPSASTTARPFGPRNDSTRPTAERTLDNWQSDLGRVCPEWCTVLCATTPSVSS